MNLGGLRTSLLALGLILCWALPATSGDDAPKADAARLDKEIRGYLTSLEIIGTPAYLKGQVIGQLQKTHPEAPPEFWKDLDPFIADQDKAFVDALFAAYRAQFTLEEMKAITAFFNTKTGKKYHLQMGHIAQDIGGQTIAWTRAVATEAKNRLKTKGYSR